MFHGLQAESHWSSDQLCLSDTAGTQAKGVNIVLLPKLMGKILWWILKVLHERAKVQGGKTPEGGLRHSQQGMLQKDSGTRHHSNLPEQSLLIASVPNSNTAVVGLASLGDAREPDSTVSTTGILAYDAGASQCQPIHCSAFLLPNITTGVRFP